MVRFPNRAKNVILYCIFVNALAQLHLLLLVAPIVEISAPLLHVAALPLIPNVSPFRYRYGYGFSDSNQPQRIHPLKTTTGTTAITIIETRNYPYQDSSLFSSDERSEGEIAEDLLERRWRKDQKQTKQTPYREDDDINNDQKNTNKIDTEIESLPLLDFSNFDDSALPVPLFTAVIILLGSLYVTGYGLYVGINGFPTEGVDGNLYPRIF